MLFFSFQFRPFCFLRLMISSIKKEEKKSKFITFRKINVMRTERDVVSKNRFRENFLEIMFFFFLDDFLLLRNNVFWSSAVISIEWILCKKEITEKMVIHWSKNTKNCQFEVVKLFLKLWKKVCWGLLSMLYWFQEKKL